MEVFKYLVSIFIVLSILPPSDLFVYGQPSILRVITPQTQIGVPYCSVYYYVQVSKGSLQGTITVDATLYTPIPTILFQTDSRIVFILYFASIPAGVTSFDIQAKLNGTLSSAYSTGFTCTTFPRLNSTLDSLYISTLQPYQSLNGEYLSSAVINYDYLSSYNPIYQTALSDSNVVFYAQHPLRFYYRFTLDASLLNIPFYDGTISYSNVNLASLYLEYTLTGKYSNPTTTIITQVFPYPESYFLSILDGYNKQSFVMLVNTTGLNSFLALNVTENQGIPVIGNALNNTIYFKIEPSPLFKLYSISDKSRFTFSIPFNYQYVFYSGSTAFQFTNITQNIYNARFGSLIFDWGFLTQYQILFNDIPFQIPEPFGAIRAGATKQFNIVLPLTGRGDIVYFSFSDSNTISSSSIINPMVPINSPLAPLISSIKYYSLSATHYLALVNISDPNGLGITKIGFNDISYPLSTLVSGDLVSGTYALQIPYPSFTSDLYRGYYTIYGFNVSYPLELNTKHPYLDENLNIIPLIPTDSHFLQAAAFSLFSFIPNIVDTSNGPQPVTLYFNITRIDKTFRPVIKIYWFGKPYIGVGENIEIVGEYDPVDNMYRADFTVPMNYGNSTVQYEISLIDAITFQQDMYQLFGESSTLTITTSDIKLFPPYISDISVYPSTTVVMTEGTPVNIWFNLTVVDLRSRFSHGFVVFANSADSLTIPFNLTTDHSMNQNFSLTIKVSICTVQTFSVKQVVLYDSNGLKSEYPHSPTTSNYLTVNSFFRISSLPNITVTCNHMTPPDGTAPYLVDFKRTYPPDDNTKIDVSTLNRVLEYKLKVADTESAISPVHQPILYCQSYDSWLSFMPVNRTVVGINTVEFGYRIELPYGFGIGGNGSVYLSIYGIVDAQLNQNGYTAAQLYNYSYPYRIQVEFNVNNINPILQSSTSVYPAGGIITVGGSGFGPSSGSPLDAYINYGNGFVKSSFISPLYVTATVQVNAIHSSTFQLKFKNRNTGVESNIITVDVLPYKTSVYNPPVVPVTCPNGCSGHGQCNANGCQCTSPYIGPSCSTTSIEPNQPPVTLPDSPTVVIETGNGNGNASDFQSIISIPMLRELGIDSQPVKIYQLGNWTFYNQTNIKPGSLNYLYSTRLNNSLSTTINVTIQYFEEGANMTFANQQINLSPFSTKISIQISPYPFNSALNTLQLVMQVKLNTTSRSESCGTKSFGLANDDQNNLQWIKLKINEQTLFGNFIRRGYIDSRPITIRNVLMDDIFNVVDPTSYTTQSFVGMTIPQYNQMAILDPTFNNLLEEQNQENEDFSSCRDSSDKKSLSNAQISGIVVGCVVFVALVTATIIYLLKYKMRVIYVKGTGIQLIKMDQTTKNSSTH